MKRILIFGQSRPTQEATRHKVLCRAMSELDHTLQYCTTRIGFASPDASPWFKILHGLLLSPVRWCILACRYALAKDHDIVFLPYPSYMDGWIGCLLAKLRKKAVIVDSFVCILDTLVSDRKLFKPAGFAARFIRQYETCLLSSSHTIFVDTDGNKDMLVKEYGLPPRKIEPIPVGIDESLWRPAPFIKAENFKVVFWCTFIPLHGANVVADAANILDKSCSNVQFTVIGTGQEAKQFKTHLERLRPGNLRWIDRFISLEAIYSYLYHSHCCLGIFGSQDKTRRVIPYKAYQCLASAKPLITARTPASEALFTDTVNAVLIPPDDPKSLADAILSLQSNSEQARTIGVNGRILYNEALSNTVIKKRIGEIVGIA